MPELKIFETEDAKRGHETVDGFDNFVSRLGLNNDNTLSAGLYVFNLMTRNRIQLEAAYRGSWVVGQVIECVADDMTRAGIEITTNEQDADIKDLLSAMSRLAIWSSMNSLIKWGRLYGGAIAVLQIEGQDLESPLQIDTVAKGQFKGLSIYDRWQLNPDLVQVIQQGPDIGLPMFYDIVTDDMNVRLGDNNVTGQQRVHHSRVIRNIGIELPFFQAITEMMWGESVLERLWDRLISFDSTTMSSANLVERANNRTVGIQGLRQIMATGGKAQAGLEAQFQMMRQFQTNEGLTIIDKEDTFQTTSYSFAGLDGVLIQFGQQLSGASQIPLVRLFGQSPAGLNSTGESDLRMYYDSINAKQERSCRRGVTLILHVMWRSTYGLAAPKDLEFTFTPLWQMSAVDKANVSKTTTETIIGAFETGLVKAGTAMKELRQASGDTGLFSNITDEDITEAELDPPPMPMDPKADPNAEKPDDPDADPDKEPVKNLDSKTPLWERIKSWLARNP